MNDLYLVEVEVPLLNDIVLRSLQELPSTLTHQMPKTIREPKLIRVAGNKALKELCIKLVNDKEKFTVFKIEPVQVTIEMKVGEMPVQTYGFRTPNHQ